MRRSKERRLRLQAEAAAQKELASVGPQKPQERTCDGCGVDITFTYKSKNGRRCKACIAKYHAEYRGANAERIAAQKKAWKETNLEHVRSLERGYAVSNAANKATARKKWSSNNKALDAALKAANRAKRKHRYVSWSNQEKIQPYYDVCAFFNDVNGYAKYHVDHIVPLLGTNVSGLHVHNNLQVILAEENSSKRNSFVVA